MVLAAKLDLISVQCGITAAFVHASVLDKEKINVINHVVSNEEIQMMFFVSREPYTDSNKPHVTSSNILLRVLFHKGLFLWNMILASS
jgi:hypothetical protein